MFIDLLKAWKIKYVNLNRLQTTHLVLVHKLCMIFLQAMILLLAILLVIFLIMLMLILLLVFADHSDDIVFVFGADVNDVDNDYIDVYDDGDVN